MKEEGVKSFILSFVEDDPGNWLLVIVVVVVDIIIIVITIGIIVL